jgi:hypothetical protein
MLQIGIDVKPNRQLQLVTADALLFGAVALTLQAIGSGTSAAVHPSLIASAIDAAASI